MAFANDVIVDKDADIVKLSQVSERDKVWDTHKSDTVSVRDIYADNDEFSRYAARMSVCSNWLGFNEKIDIASGEVSYKLNRASFCRVRTCPICQWRRSLMWKARFYKALPKIQEQHENACFMLLTLTIRNCEVKELRETLNLMHTSFRKMMKYEKIKKAFLGWVRATEVTRAEDGTAHPHYHVLIMVKKSYFASRDYIKQDEFVEFWQRACKLNYKPNVDIRKVKSRDKNKSGVENAIAETLKYTVKPSDLKDPKWLYEYTRQIFKLRFIDTGGTLKDVFKLNEDDDDESEDLIHFDGSKEPNEGQNEIIFRWFQGQRSYGYKR